MTQERIKEIYKWLEDWGTPEGFIRNALEESLEEIERLNEELDVAKKYFGDLYGEWLALNKGRDYKAEKVDPEFEQTEMQLD